MKKRILGFAIAAMSLVSFTSAAQSAAAVTSQPATTSQAVTADLYAGMNLTEAQKTELTELNNKCRAARKEARADKGAARKEARRQYLADVRKIVGAENYVTFLENMVTNKGGRHMGAKMGKKGGKKGKANGSKRGTDRPASKVAEAR